eukprot:scaffold1503_cov250-Pinguiococcus_pyrenoidosus.AAC.9
MRQVSRKVPLKCSCAAAAALEDRKPTKPNLRERPSPRRMTLASVTSPSSAKCSRRRRSSTYAGRFFTQSRLMRESGCVAPVALYR